MEYLHRLVAILLERNLHQAPRMWPWSHIVCGRRNKARLRRIVSLCQVVREVEQFELTGIH
jgi:hypothetical protein